MRYGVPYKGSKNQIAEWVCSHFPKATNFYDLFAGGCAITQIALMKSEYKNYFCNDIDFDGISLFMDAIYGKYQNESRWISREDFICIDAIEKSVLLNSGASKKAIEKLFIPKRQRELYKKLLNKKR